MENFDGKRLNEKTVSSQIADWEFYNKVTSWESQVKSFKLRGVC